MTVQLIVPHVVLMERVWVMVHASVLPATLVKLAMKVSCKHDSVRGHFQTTSAFLDVNINPPSKRHKNSLYEHGLGTGHTHLNSHTTVLKQPQCFFDLLLLLPSLLLLMLPLVNKWFILVCMWELSTKQFCLSDMASCKSHPSWHALELCGQY